MRISSNTSVGEPNGVSAGATFSRNGQYVVFYSLASNLVSGDTNGKRDVFRKDLITGDLQIVSVTAAGVQGNMHVDASPPSVSSDGRYVAFFSPSTNLLPCCTSDNTTTELYLKDMTTGELRQVSVPTNGTESTKTFIYASPGHEVAVSDTGRYVVFAMTSQSMVSPSIATTQVWMRDMQLNTTTRLSTDAFSRDSTQQDSFHPSIASDNITVAFASTAYYSVSAGQIDCFIKNTQNSSIIRISQTAAGVIGDADCSYPAISANGKAVVYYTQATNQIAGVDGTYNQVFYKNLTSGALKLVSASNASVVGNGNSGDPRVSSDGRYVLFWSTATNLVSGISGTRVYVKDMNTAAIVVVSSNATNSVVTGTDISQDIIDSTKALFYTTGALVSSDTNGLQDIYLKTIPW